MMKPEISAHPFWSEFFRRGIPLHPELADKSPTGKNMRKIAPGIGNRVQVDINWSASCVSLRPLSRKPENLRVLIQDRQAFEEQVGVPEEWSEGSSEHLGITVLPAPRSQQKSWSTERQVTEALQLYGRIKEFLQPRVLQSEL